MRFEFDYDSYKDPSLYRFNEETVTNYPKCQSSDIDGKILNLINMGLEFEENKDKKKLLILENILFERIKEAQKEMFVPREIFVQQVLRPTRKKINRIEKLFCQTFELDQGYVFVKEIVMESHTFPDNHIMIIFEIKGKEYLLMLPSRWEESPIILPFQEKVEWYMVCLYEKDEEDDDRNVLICRTFDLNEIKFHLQMCLLD